ncbi:MAG: efflux RND transporter periplasmic adaptor subunit [Chloroflexi bacterium]|nr:efflux RND transporter periplasmic adaptor subunit [Chloroflexota bacterium]
MLTKIRANWKLIGGVVFVVLMIGVALVIATPPSNARAKQTQQTVVVQRGNLTATVTGNGTITAESTVDLSFQTNGTVKRVLVQEGDTVQAGQVLAELDDRTLQAEVASAHARLASAQAKLKKTKQGATDEEIASAKASLQSAQVAHDLAIKESETASLDFESAKLAVEKAQVAVGVAQAAYDRIGGASNPMIGMTQQAKELQSATLEYQSALTKYNTQLRTVETSKKSKVESAKANIEKAKADFAKMQVKAEDVAMDQASVEQAEQSLKQAQINLENAVLKAPFAGVVTAVNVVTGARTSNVPIAVKMMNVNPLHVNLKLSENDVVKVQSNQPVKLTTDSLKEWQTDGKVSYIAPLGESASGVVTFIVRVDFVTADPRVKVGMTANLDITTAHKDNVLVVPNTALLPKGNERIVQVVGADGKTSEVEVQTGLSDGSFTEITGGIAEGTRIVAFPSSGTVRSSMPFP